MIRINLLPPEIIQKRKDEQRWRWIVIGGVILFVVVGAVFALMQIRVFAAQSEVAAVKQQAADLQKDAERFQVFQLKEADLSKRKQVAEGALLGRVDWSALYSEIALVLPTDVYLMRLTTTEPKTPALGTIAIDGRAIDYPFDVPDLGYKSVAKLMVRLAELPKVQGVWLTSSVKPAAGSVGATETAYIVFGVTGEIPGEFPPGPASSPGVPAPPASP